MHKPYSWAAETHVGHHRDHNEDRYAAFTTPIGEAFLVCDGMGGHAAGDVAATLAIQHIKALLERATPTYLPAYWLRRALHYAHQGILEYAQTQYGAGGMGTTAVVLLLTPAGEAWWAHTGDSRLYLLRQGHLYPLTHDHSYVSLLVDTGHLSPEAAFGHPQSNQLLFTLGASQGFTIVEASSFPLKVQAGDRFLLCSDGLSGLVPEDRIAQILSQAKPPADIVRELIQAALEAGGHDNTTAIVVEATQLTAHAPSHRRRTALLILAGMALFLLGLLGGGLFLKLPAAESQKPAPSDTSSRAAAPRTNSLHKPGRDTLPPQAPPNSAPAAPTDSTRKP